MKLTAPWGVPVNRFAFVPVRLDDGRWIWLEWYAMTRVNGAIVNWRERRQGAA